MKKLLTLMLLVSLSSPAVAWNDKGHMVVARLAWRQLTESQQAKVVTVLKKHPHYDEFLAAKKPSEFSEDEWVFMRAATWADWVRSHHTKEYHHGPWHYIDYPFVPPGSKFDAKAFEPNEGQEDAVTTMENCMKKIASGTDEEKAVYITWLFHLVGDIHQPCHTTAMFSERFPTGDQGANLIQIQIRSGPVKLHSFWDGLLGTGLTAGAIGKDVVEIETVLKDKAATIQPEIDGHTTPRSWALEGFELAKKAVYLDGELKFSLSKSNQAAPPAPADYASNAGRTARVQIGKAGVRLANQLGKLFP